jgi:hypothetical protein
MRQACFKQRCSLTNEAANKFSAWCCPLLSEPLIPERPFDARHRNLRKSGIIYRTVSQMFFWDQRTYMRRNSWIFK